MGKQETKAPAPAQAKAETKRTVLTPEQRVAKLEAELAAARKKAEERANKAKDQARDKRTKLVEKRNALNVQIAELNEIIGDGDVIGDGPDQADDAARTAEAKAS